MLNRKKNSVILSLILFSTILVLCSFSKDNTDNSGTRAEIVEATVVENVKCNSVSEDSIAIPAFYIDVKLTEQAAKIITSTKETIIVNFSISFGEEDFVEGSPFRKQVTEDGLIWLCSFNKEVHFGEIAKIEGLKIPQKLYDDLKIKEIWGFGQCWTGRRSFEDNLLQVTTFTEFDVLKVTLNEIFTIDTKLIGEND